MTDDLPGRANDALPGSNAGPIESTKTAIIVSLREAFTGTELGQNVSGSDIFIDMEYPMEKENYPGIWVKFSFTKFARAGIGHQVMTHTVENEGTPDKRINWEPVREFIFEATVTLAVVALTSLQRDRIADVIVVGLMAARPPTTVLTDPQRDTKEHRGLLTALENNPYVSLGINLDQFNPGGQAETTGVPWDPEILGYEDTYSFDLLGQTTIVYRHDGTYTLRGVDPEPFFEGTMPDNEEGWV